MKKILSAKITPPTLSGVMRRERLFTLLDAKTERPVIWVSSPAGSGKTKLISSYIDVRKFPCIWYQCDETDADLPTFFYYMGLAAKKTAPRRRTALPLLTPEYLQDIPTFTRRYFEILYGMLVPQRVPRPSPREFFIVLDNYQDVPSDSAFQDMIVNGLDGVPEGVHIVVISRSGPPAPFARMQASDRIGALQYNDLRFTFEESKDLVLGRIPNLGLEDVRAVHERTEGWAAGIVLMLERVRLDGAETVSGTDAAHNSVFDYFAGEIFKRTEKGMQEFLLRTAFLPSLNVSLAEQLTGKGLAGFILSTLARNNYFTERLAGDGEDYRYHPLFRDYLINRARTVYGPGKLAALQTEAAQILEQAGHIEDAARLYLDAKQSQHIAQIVIRHARDLLRQGRKRIVAEWIGGIPGKMAANDPWLLYWTGMCSFPFDVPRMRGYLEKAFALFEATGDAAGIYLSWAGIVDTHTFDLGEWKGLDTCIEVFNDLGRTYDSLPSREIDLIVSSRMLISLILRRIDQTGPILEWYDRVSALLRENPSVDIQMETMFYMSVYYLWKGEYHKNAILLEEAEEILHRRPSPLMVISIKLMQGIHSWVTALYDPALKQVSEGLAVSEKSGVHIYDSLLWSFKAAAEMATGRMADAKRSLKNQMATAVYTAKTLDIFFYHINSAWYAILDGRPSLAAENMETISSAADKMEAPYYRALWHIGMAQAAFLQSRKTDADACIQTAHQIARSMKSPVMEWYSLLVRAWFLFQEGKEAEGLRSLRSALALGKRHGYVHLEFYRPSVMQFLYAKALEEGIESEYVKELIGKLRLTPPPPGNRAASPAFHEGWPYPIRIRTLGRFGITRDHEPLAFTGKVQKKPLELLKAIIAFGCTDVPVEYLTDVVWPDVDGDRAYKSFETTLSRLRRLLGGDDLVKYGGGHISIDLLRCWIDSLALESVLATARNSPDDQTVKFCERALGLYRGPFLASDAGLPWTARRREILKYGVIRIIVAAGRRCENLGHWDAAREYYLRGLDTDDLAEEFYQRLMVCYQKLGNHAEAVKVFNRCRSQLRNGLGIDPSAETKAIYASMLGGQ